MTSAAPNSDPRTLESASKGENVVQRLNRRLGEAKRMGFRVRTEWLEDQQATWC
ncbi:MAG: hypothetical protein MI861_03755 [Pirellulales bacterium]|nr:hypothetical protein [Pirellulales bacterium]